MTKPRDLNWYGEAKTLAEYHTDRFGDDVVLHVPDDAGDMFICEDCGWISAYAPADDDDSWGL